MAQPVNPSAKPMQSHGSHAIATARDNFPSQNLWLGNLSPQVGDAELKALFESHGAVIGVSLYASRNFAFVYFKEVCGAISAMHALQGHVLRGNRLKIEFAKPAKPCNSLWVAGISQVVSKEVLEKEFLKFGKIKEVRFLRDCKTASIDYARLEDATQALKIMNGKRIGEDQIHVDFLRSAYLRREQHMDAKEGQFPGRNLAPFEFRQMAEDSLKNYPESCRSGTEKQNVITSSNDPRIVAANTNEFGHRKDLIAPYPGLGREVCKFPFRPVPMNIQGSNRPVLPRFPPPPGVPTPDVYMRPPLLSSFFTFKPALLGPEKSSYQTQIGGPNWRWSSPAPGIGSSPSAGFSLSNNYVSGPQDVSDSSQLQRESKRSRLDPAALPHERTENQGGSDENCGLNSLNSGRASASLRSVITGGVGPLDTEGDCIWKGVIAKAGITVCRARCILIGQGIDAHIPEVINCSARTGLDLLSKHYDNAIAFNIVSFLPDTEDDSGPYTEFLRLLVSKNRAGVAKFDDGTTLFLVPPSDFLTKVLNISGPEHLHGIVLKFPQAVPSSTSMNFQSVHNSDHSYSQMPPDLGQTCQTEHFQAGQDWEIQESISRIDAEKNERYKATMLLAASLLSQIHQKHGNQPGQEMRNE